MRIGIGLLVLLGACNLAPPYQAPVVSVPTDYKEGETWQKAQPSAAPLNEAWWGAFNDRALNELEPQVATANADLASAVARYDEARALAGEAEAATQPQATAEASFTANRQSAQRPLRSASSPSHYGANQLDISVSYELDLWGKLRNAAAAQLALAQASAADMGAVRLSLQATLATDYFSLRGLDAQQSLLGQTVDAYRKARDLTATMVNAKIASPLDQSRAQTQLDAARAQMSDVAARRALLEHAIAILIGKPPADFSLAPEPASFAIPEIPLGIPSTLLQRRPDIAEAEQRVMSANSEIGVARAAFYPSITFGLLGGTQSTGLNLLSAANSLWSLGPGLSLPIFDGGFLDAQEQATYARFHESQAQYRSTVLKAFGEVEDNLALIQHLGQEAKDEGAAVASAQQTLDGALALYRQGAASYLEVVTAETPLLQAQQVAIDVDARREEAAIGLIKALGGGWTKS